eukprot:scaffold24698_cov63-Phaeocystis_antarctica.AAC.7
MAGESHVLLLHRVARPICRLIERQLLDVPKETLRRIVIVPAAAAATAAAVAAIWDGDASVGALCDAEANERAPVLVVEHEYMGVAHDDKQRLRSRDGCVEALRVIEEP